MLQKILCIFVSAVLILLSLVSCSPASRDPLAYTSRAFTAELKIESDGHARSLSLSIGKVRDDGVPRDVSVSFLSPDSLCGVCVKRSDGVTKTTAGDLTVAGGDGYLSFCRLLVPEGNVTDSGIVELGGIRATYLLVSTELGNISVYLNRDGSPLRIESGQTAIEVVWFEYGD